MLRFSFLIIFFLNFLTSALLSRNNTDNAVFIPYDLVQQDTLQGNQILYNGRVWRNLYYKVKGDQFLFSKDFLPGSVSLEGKTFNNIMIRYDIYNDEVMTPANEITILQLNKEMVDSFTFTYLNKKYYFKHIQSDSLKEFNGYMNILYDGKTSLYVKYKKEIQLLGIDNKYDVFYQEDRIYFVRNGIVNLVKSKRELLKLLDEYKLQIRSFIRKKMLKVTKKEPESFVPVIEYYDSLYQ
jgi:hypothetical protein